MTANDSVLNGHYRAEPATNGTSNELNGTSNGVDGAANGLVHGFHGKPPQPNGDTQPPPATTERREPIAIIGCGLRLPGGVHDAEAFWDLLINKRDGRCIVPADRYNVSGYHTEQQPAKPGCVATEHGYFLNSINPAEADATFWSMTARELAELDPQQRLALEVAYETLQSSGTTGWKGKSIGCFVGVYGEDWAHIQAQDNQDHGMYRVAGFGDFALANRISYELGLRGPSMVLRTACSSSLTGLHEACLALEAGECESSLVVGTSMLLDPQLTASLTAQGVLSPNGRCRSFDAGADGYARGEAIVAVHVKKLSVAIRDNDPIRAVIRASCANSDGKTAGLTQPNSESHAALIRRSHALAGISNLSQTAMVECHGTGTQVGDPMEASAVASVFGEYGMLIGSVKPNVGHSEGASGITSVIKMMLALEHNQIPPNINFEVPSKKIPWEEARLKVPTEVMPWPAHRAERVGVNSFGIGGANAHVLMESARCAGVQTASLTNDEELRSDDPKLLTFSAHTADALRSAVQSHEKYLQAHPESIDDLQYTLAVRREHMAHLTFSVVPGGLPEGNLNLAQFRKPHANPLTVWTFTGQGAQWAQMGARLILEDGGFKSTIRKLENVLRKCESSPSWSMEEELLKPTEMSRLSEAEFSQPCCTAVQVALVDMLRRSGISPSAVVGHSSGEIGAAFASGAITAEDAIRIAYYRGQATKSLLAHAKTPNQQSVSGGMAAIGLGRKSVEPFLQAGVIVGCENSPNSVTLTGDGEPLEETMERIRNAHPDTLVRRLRVECAYHSHHMELVADDYAAMLGHIQVHQRTVPFYSSVSGARLEPSALLDASYWVANLVSPVLFSPAVSALLRDLDTPAASALVFLEIGPHGALGGPIRQIFRAQKTSIATEYVQTLVRNEDAKSALLSSIGNLFQLGVDDIDFSTVFPRGRVLTNLPTYPWQRGGNYWLESRLSQERRLRKHVPHDILGLRVHDVAGSTPTWRNMLRLDNVPWIRDHVVEGDTIFPGAGYVCMAGEAVRQLSGTTGFVVRRVTIKTALTMHEGQAVELITSLRPLRLTTSLDSSWYEFEVSSLRGDAWVKHAFGQVRAATDADAIPVEADGGGTTLPLPRQVNAEKWYQNMSRLGLDYTGPFRGLRDVESEVKGNVARANVTNETSLRESAYAQHPSTIDLVFQLFSVAASNGLSRRLSSLAVPTYIERLYVGAMDGDLRVEASSTATPRGSLQGDARATAGNKTVIQLEELRMMPLADAQDSRGEDPHAATELVWRPDIHALDAATLMRPREGQGHLDITGRYGQLLEKMALACMIESGEACRDLGPHQKFLLKFRAWLDKMRGLAADGTYFMVPECREIVDMTSEQRLALIGDILHQTEGTEVWPVAAALHRIVSTFGELFSGSQDAIALLSEGDVLGRIYDLGRFTDFGDVFRLASHYKPNLKILEIGAGSGGTTQPVLNSLVNANGDRMYYSYTFTDVSPGFLVSAKERFKNFDGVEYRALDITVDPLAQGFEPHSYDMIVASNVIHATPSIIQALRHVHKLLAPRGRLFLQEICPPTKWITYIMGNFSGWWLGEEDGRVEEPYLAPREWDQVLRDAGFAGLNAIHSDEQFNNNMIAMPLQPRESRARPVTLLVSGRDGSGLDVSGLEGALRDRGHDITICFAGELLPAGTDIISLLDIEEPFFHGLDEAQFQWFQSLLPALADDKARVLWVTGAAQLGCTDPRYGMTLGAARTIRSELDLDFATVETARFDGDGQPGWQGIVAACYAEFQSCLAAATATEDKSLKPNYEWAEVDGVLQVGRFQWTSVNRELDGREGEVKMASSEASSQAPRKLGIGKPGLLSSLHWTQKAGGAAGRPTGSMVRVAVRAVGLNFKDVLICMGVVDGQGVDDEGLGCECSGVIEAVGPDVTGLLPGDRVMVLGIGTFTTSFECPEMACARIPDDLAFSEAASMPTVYGTAIYSLINKARLDKGQSVLIHSACGGVGIAAIQICRMIGAEIYCTVGSEDKVRHLVEEHRIPRHRIFKSRDVSFLQDVKKATGGRGVDVVLNSLSGELLHASWECVAPFGCMVEIGKRDLIGHGALALGPFEQNRGYSGVEFARLSSERPDIPFRILRDVVKYYNQGYVAPIRPITAFDATELEDAMRYMQKGVHIGKIVVNMPVDAEQLIAQPKRAGFNLPKEASYILVGGLGGLGQAIAVWMAEAGATEIIFMSRSASRGAHEQFLGELQAMGCNPILVAGSVSVKEDVRRAVRAARYQIGGVINMSMVLNDIRLLDMPFNDWAATVEPKVLGTWNLHEVLEEESQKNVDFFLLFSSYSGLVGHWGQSNYAAANTFLDAFSATVDVGVMEDIGYVSRNANVLGHFHKTSTHVLREQDLLDTIQLLLQRGKSRAAKVSGPGGGFASKSQIGIGVRSTLPLDSPQNRTVWKNDIRMAAYRNLEAEESGAGKSGAGNGELKEFLASSARDPSGLDADAAADFLAREVGRTLYGFMLRDAGDDDIAALDVTQSLKDIGVDSLVGIELRNWFRQALSLEVTVLQMMEAPSLFALGLRMAQMLKEKFTGHAGANEDYLATKMP
ncbi:hypothetical protein LY76DRAFT_671662 [Colletotrichum caudatum]|nr:hypothetical protein LY76DRAFT_671662 [Colletotrichum caudatum]